MTGTSTGTRLQVFSMPDVGEGLTEAEVLGWRVAVGDTVTVNQVLVEIETAKAAVELPSPFAGRVHALLVEPGVTVEVGTPIISVDTDPGAGDLPDSSPPAASSEPAAAPANGSTDDEGSGTTTNGEGAKIGEVTADGRIATLVGYVSAGASTARRPRRGNGRPADVGISTAGPQHAVVEPAPASAAASAEPAPLATPPVRKLAKDLGIDLAAVTATRQDGVISRADVENAVAAKGSAPKSGPGQAYDPATREHRIPVKGIRRATAAAMVASAFSAPHVTEFLTVDVTPMMELRDRLRGRPEFADLKLSPLAFAARAVCLAARRTPEINSMYQGGPEPGSDVIVVKQYVNLGIAAATPRGLVVPVIQDADRLDLAGLAAALRDLAATAREGHTSPAQMSGGTFTITNVGVFGVDTGTPIINPGEAAILALGSVKDAPWVVDGALAVRKVCQLSLSFDHRVVDGQQGSQFLADVGALLADPGLAIAF